MTNPHPNNPAQRNPKFAKAIFDAARHPKAWLGAARRLRASADAIFERETPVAKRFWDELHRIGSLGGSAGTSPDFDEAQFPFPNFDAACMLYAFTIENLLKGLAVAKDLVTFSSQELPKNLRTHDLRKLCQLTAPRAIISPRVLDSLTYMAEWRGRYPLPTSVDKFWPMDVDGTAKAPGFSPDPQKELAAYCNALEVELRDLL